MVSLAILFFILVVFTSVIQVILWKKEKVTAFSIMHATFSLYYILAPFLILVFKNQFSTQTGRFLSVIFLSSEKDIIDSYLYILIAYILLIGTYIFANKLIFRRNIKRITIFIPENDRPKKTVYYFGMFFFILGGSSTLLFFNELGGFSQALKYADILRYAGTDSSKYYGPMGALYRMLSFFILGAPYCFMVYYNLTKDKKIKILFYFSLVITMMYLLFNSGRSTIIFFLLPFLLSYVIKKKVNIFLAFITLLVVVVGTAKTFDILLYQMTVSGFNLSTIATIDSSFTDNILSALNDIAYPFANILLVWKINMYEGFRYGQDYFIWFLDIIPSRIFSNFGLNVPEFLTLNVSTSDYYHQLFSDSYGGVPTDLITSGLRQYGLAGLIINTVIFAWISILIDFMAKSISKDYNIIAFKVQLIAFTFIPNNDLTDIFRGSLYILILVVLLFVVYRGNLYEKRFLFFNITRKKEKVFEK